MGPFAPRILIVGAGGLGAIAGAELAAAGHAVVLQSHNPDLRATLQTQGVTVIDGGRRFTQPVDVVERPAAQARFDLIILATQPPSVEAAAREAAPHLAELGRMVVLQNGLCEPRIEAIVGPRVIGAVVAWGATMQAPGLYERTARGGFTLGRWDGSDDPMLDATAAWLTPVGPCRRTANLRGVRWSKLALNCAISSLGTLAGARLGPLVAVRRYRRLALQVMTETVQVATAEGVRLEKVAGTLSLPWIALTDLEAGGRGGVGLASKHAVLLAVGAKYRRMRSSMLSAIERGRPPAVDFLNGEVVRHGARHGVATPVNAAVVEAVWRLARGEDRPAHATLDALCARLSAMTPSAA